MLLNDKDIRQLCTLGDWICPHVPAISYQVKVPMIHPFSESVQEGGVVSYGLSHAGYDLRLGNELWVFKNTSNQVIDPKRFRDEEYRRQVFDVVRPIHIIPFTEHRQAGYVIPPHSYALGASLEYLRIPSHLKGRCVGKSTLARCGILINTTPLEPGWHGHLTIEISNITPCPALVYAGEGIAQLEFELLTGPPEMDYEAKAGKYQGQSSSPEPARVKE